MEHSKLDVHLLVSLFSHCCTTPNSDIILSMMKEVALQKKKKKMDHSLIKSRDSGSGLISAKHKFGVDVEGGINDSESQVQVRFHCFQVSPRSAMRGWDRLGSTSLWWSWKNFLWPSSSCLPFGSRSVMAHTDKLTLSLSLSLSPSLSVLAFHFCDHL